MFKRQEINSQVCLYKYKRDIYPTFCLINNPTVRSAIENLVHLNPEDRDIQIERNHRRGGLVLVKAIPEPLMTKTPEDVHVRVLIG